MNEKLVKGLVVTVLAGMTWVEVAKEIIDPPLSEADDDIQNMIHRYKHDLSLEQPRLESELGIVIIHGLERSLLGPILFKINLEYAEGKDLLKPVEG